jgi:hypothetical protein
LNLKWLEGVSDRVITQHSKEDHMSVIGPSCSLPSSGSPDCGCAPKQPSKQQTGGKVAATASVSAALAAAACTACCVLPFTLPAALLALAGGSIAVLDHAHGWMTLLAAGAVIAGWGWLAWQRRKTGHPIARRILALMIMASVVTTTTGSWFLIAPTVFKTLGIVKKKPVSQDG